MKDPMPIPARWVRLLLSGWLMLCAVMQLKAQSYSLIPNITTLPAGIYGHTVFVVLSGDTSSTRDVDLCFYTGYGSAAPLRADVYFSVPNGIEATFGVAPSTIQDVPPSAFTSGTFPAQMYTVPIATTACTGPTQANAGPAIAVTLEYPRVTTLSIPSAPRQNPDLTRRLPARIEVYGKNFAQQLTASFNTPSDVVFTAGSITDGDAVYITESELLSVLPTAIPSTATSVSLTVCNTSVYSYCSDPFTLPLTPLQSDFGTLTASPALATPSQPISFSANFGPGTPTVAGAPSGQVSFTDMGTPFYTAPLLLDTTATFVTAKPRSLTASSATLNPIVADFNNDGIPDVLFVEPNAVTNGSTFPVIHVLRGTTPTGQFAADIPYTGLQKYPCAALLSTAVADFNNDGFLDLAILCGNPSQAGPSSEVIYTLLNQKNGILSSVVTSYGPVFGTSIAAADFNKDGNQDLVISGPLNAAGETGLQVLLGKGNGGFAAGSISSGLDTATSASFGGFQITAADLNGDGYPDIAILNGAASSGAVDKLIQLFQNDGTGAFTRAATVQTDGTSTTAFFVTTISPGQLPGLIITSTASSSPGISVAVNNSASNISYFDTFLFTPVPGLAQAVVGDFNGDGFPDVAVTDATSTHILNGNGTGVFAATYTSLLADPPAGSTLLAASDENGDGYADLLAASTSSGTTTIYDYITAGTASASTPDFTFVSGVHRIIANFPGTVEISPAAAQTDVTITNTTATSAALTTSTSSPINYGSPLTLYATITDPTATGTVSFYNGTTLLGTAPLVSNSAYAVAALTPSALAVGTYSFTAAYSGDATHAGITSTAFAFVVNPISTNLAWTPRQAFLSYGIPLSASQLDAVATGLSGSTVPGTFTYSPALGSILATGNHALSVTFTPSNTNYTAATATASITITQAVTNLTWLPNPASITYGTALSVAQLDASAATLYTTSVPGTYAYTPALSTALAVGTHALSVTFTPTDTLDFSSASASTSITVTQATPVITWPKPADVIVDTVLSSTQLDATAATPQGTALPGTFVYTPPSGTKLSVASTQTLSVLFTPTDTADYNTATATVSINVGPIGISSIVPSTALLGDPAKTITLTGTGFSPNSVVQMSGPSLPATPIPTTYISSTSLTAVIPASDFLTVQILQVSVYDPTKDLPSNAVPFTITAPSTSVGFNAPATISPASQNAVVFHLAPYPAPLTATVTLTFQPAGTLPDDPNIVFTSGIRTYTVTQPAHSAELDLPVTFQSGTVSGALTLTLSLEAGGVNVTPASSQPITIQQPVAVPGISSVTLSASGDMLTVVTRGYSNTRKITGAAFHFTATPAGSISTPDLNVDVTSLFSTWYASPASDPYGSEFTYTEVFNLSSDASVVGQVTVTLTNDVGESQEANTP